MIVADINTSATIATVFLAAIGLAIFISIVMFLLSLRAQHQYDHAELPMIPGTEAFDAHESDELERIAVEEEEEGNNAGSAFAIYDDDELPDDMEEGGLHANELLKEARGEKKPRKKLFRREEN